MFVDPQGKSYYRCGTCDLRYMDKAHYLSASEERAHYLMHNNDVLDVRYQDFVRPLFEAIKNSISIGAKGLDFGAGTGPVMSHLLTQCGYVVRGYDPYFANDNTVFNECYDFIFACEVIEHFYRPLEEFLLMKSHLMSGGALYFMTGLVSEDMDFEQWHYRRDPTHVVFYSQATFEWIKKHLGFQRLEFPSRNVIVLRTG